jgi:hypothetical protein
MQAIGQTRKMAIASAIAILAALGLAASVSYAFPTPTYSNNGLTCSFPQELPASLQSVVREVVQTTPFLSTTNGQPYLLQYWGMITQQSQTFGNTTTQLPDSLEIGFATYGAGTSCGETGHFLSWIDVQIPVVNGTYYVAGESVHMTGSFK